MSTQILIPPEVTKNEIIYPQGEFWSDEPPLETYQHLQQIIILLKSLQWLWQDKKDYFCAGNLTIYYSPNQKKSEYFRGPDFFVVLNTDNDETRKSWVVWEEGGKYPNVIVEILSDSTAKFDHEVALRDRSGKKEIYQDIFRTPDYFWFDPFTLEFQGFTLISGTYQAITPNEQGWLYSEQLELYLGLHEGKLRYFTPDGELVSTPEESAIQERQKADKLAQKLRELGINPDDIV
ncbi:Uma2 family endonuclease [Geminocystis herdmanii]|uniref:Uma2 family endonuclease n=1 Tax=Geminocystis herdmanii TaxID=669359 RepID=UPI00034CFC19|nr:Uma2 family endonuclease [Geminocystis herdmanii]